MWWVGSKQISLLQEYTITCPIEQKAALTVTRSHKITRSTVWMRPVHLNLGSIIVIQPKKN